MASTGDRIAQPIRRTVRRAAAFDPVRKALFRYYHWRSTRRSLVHPFDARYGVDTGGELHGTVLGLGGGTDPGANNGYLGSQPSIIRAALQVIPDPQDAAFVDIGCGKGRALIVASEFGFRSVVGIEISPELAQIAERNAATVARNHPERVNIAVVTGDALDIRHLPAGRLVIYLYNSFGRALIERLRENIEEIVGRQGSAVHLVYYNPVWGEVFDESPLLRRVYAENLPYDPTETGYGPDTMDAVIVWQDAEHAPTDVPATAPRPIVVMQNGWHAELG
jgi:SAM-dependent methyltransferase